MQNMFSPTSGLSDRPEIIPAGSLVKAILQVKEMQTSQRTGSHYVNVELRVAEGPYERRVVFEMIMDPFHPANSEGGKRMGLMALTRICETAGIFKPGDPDSYARYNDASFDDVLRDIDGAKVGVKIKVERGTDGHADKNKVAEWLTPNPASESAYKLFCQLRDGKSAGAGPAGGAFGGGARPTAPAGGGPSWLKGPGAAQPAASAAAGVDDDDDVPF